MGSAHEDEGVVVRITTSSCRVLHDGGADESSYLGRRWQTCSRSLFGQETATIPTSSRDRTDQS